MNENNHIAVSKLIFNEGKDETVILFYYYLKKCINV